MITIGKTLSNGEKLTNLCEEINKKLKTNYSVIPTPKTQSLITLKSGEKNILHGTFSQIISYLINYARENYVEEHEDTVS